MTLTKKAESSKKRTAAYNRIHKGDRLYGTTIVGERGQIVIPAEARKDFGLKPGDQVIAIGNKVGKILTFVKADNVGDFFNMVMDHLSGSGQEENFKTYFQKILKSSRSKNKLSK